MKTYINTTSLLIMCLILAVASCGLTKDALPPQEPELTYKLSFNEGLKNSTCRCFYTQNDSVIVNKLADYDLIVCTSGQINKTVHYSIDNSILTTYTYSSLDDTLKLLSSSTKTIDLKDQNLGIDNVFYQILPDDVNVTDTYGKRVSFFKNGLLKGRIAFLEVRYPLCTLPRFEEINKLLDLACFIEGKAQ